MNDFTPNLEAQQKSIEAMLNNPELNERLCYNDWHERTGGTVAEFGKYIVSLPKLETTQPEDHIIRGEE